MDIEILVSSMLRSHGFIVNTGFLTIRGNKVFKVDYHPPGILLYTELNVEKGYAYNEYVHVNPRLRHRGIGKRLSSVHEEICRESGLTILINNNRNPEFWKKQGYRRLNPFRQMLLARQLDIEFKEQSMYKLR